MDNLISQYMQDTFHPDLVDTLIDIFELFSNFGIPDYESDLISIIALQSITAAEDTQDQFISVVREKLDNILTEHMIVVNNDVTLQQKLQLNSALWLIQDLDDYSNVITILESDMSPDEQLAEILSQLCVMSATVILTCIDNFDPILLTHLKKYIYDKEESAGIKLTSFTDLQKKIAKNLQVYKKFIEGKTALGLLLLESNVMIGQSLERYIPFVHESLKGTDYQQLATDVLSLILLTDEGFNNPLITYRKNSNLILDDLTTIGRVDVVLTQMYSAFETFKHKLETEIPTPSIVKAELHEPN